MPETAPPPPAVRCDDLSVARRGMDRRVIDGVTFVLAPGGAIAVMGPTGSGKSSLAGLLAGTDAGLHVVGGRAEMDGIDVRRRGRARRIRRYRTGHIAQAAGAHLDARSTVMEIVSEPVTSRDRRVNERALALRVATLLDELRLPLGVAERYPYELSAGMRQRVALAQALILDPRVLVADEPFANLDVDVRGAVREAMLRRRRTGMALLVVTNEPATVEALDAEVLVLRRGFPVGVGARMADVRWTPDGNGRAVA